MWTIPLRGLVFVLGGLRGRIHGGWLGISRILMYGISGGLNYVWMVHLGGSPYWCILGAIAIECFWAPGHQWTSFRALILRYGPLGLYWWYAQKWWPDHWRLGSFIDGPIAVAEILARATMYGVIIPLFCWAIS